ncbi:MAG: regulatory protein RecX [Phycisphaerales bacterium]
MSEAKTITALRPTQRDPTRVMIRVGGKVVATLPRKVVDDLHIAVGVAWTESLAASVAQAVDEDKAYRYALNALARRAMSTGDMRDRIKRRGHDDAAAMRVVERLVERGWLNDEQFGRAYIEQLRSQKPAGPRLLAFKLRQKKVEAKLIARLLGEGDASHDDLPGARRLAEQRLRGSTLRRCDPATRKRRLWGALARRGFTPDVIMRVLRDLPGLRDSHEED